MNKHVLFIQGGGDGGYEADTELVASLQKTLGTEYEINYPEIQDDESASDFGWPQQIGRQLSTMEHNVILVAHSLGSSMLLKYLSENVIEKKIAGIFLISTPFWSGNEDWKKGLKLREDFPEKLPEKVPVFLYHCQDDEEVPFSHLALYREKLAQATFREIQRGGHQLNNELTLVARDIKSVR